MTCIDSIYSDLYDISASVNNIESSLESLRRTNEGFLETQINNLLNSLEYVPDHDEFTDSLIENVRYFLSELVAGRNRIIIDQIAYEDSLNSTLTRIELESLRMDKV